LKKEKERKKERKKEEMMERKRKWKMMRDSPLRSQGPRGRYISGDLRSTSALNVERHLNFQRSITARSTVTREKTRVE